MATLIEASRNSRFMNLICLSALLVLTACSNSRTMDLAEEHPALDQFRSIEYHLPIRTGANIHTRDIQRLDLIKQLHFIDFTHEKKHMRVSFFDTPDHLLATKSLILRLRTNMDNPDKSKITIKSRSEDITGVYKLPDCGRLKHEIDISPGKTRYSASADIPLQLDTIPENVNELVNLAQTGITAQCRDALMPKGIVLNNLSTPGFIDIYRFKGRMKVSSTQRYIAVVLEIWKLGDNRLIGELSFKGDVSNKEELDAVYDELYKLLHRQQLIRPGNHSKTEAYFSYFNGE